MKYQSIYLHCKKCNKMLLQVCFISVIKFSSQDLVLFCPECKNLSNYLTSADPIKFSSFSFGLYDEDEDETNSTKIFLKKVIEN